jgi:hypothetical protein
MREIGHREPSGRTSAGLFIIEEIIARYDWRIKFAAAHPGGAARVIGSRVFRFPEDIDDGENHANREQAVADRSAFAKKDARYDESERNAGERREPSLLSFLASQEQDNDDRRHGDDRYREINL